MVLGFRSGNVGVGRWSSNQSHKLADPFSIHPVSDKTHSRKPRPILGNPYPYARIPVGTGAYGGGAFVRRAAEKSSSRKPGFRHHQFSEIGSWDLPLSHDQ